MYDKMVCWCETNDPEKTKSIKEAEEKMDMLISEIEELTGSSARFGTEIKNLGKDIAKYEDSPDKATTIRKKELTELVAEEDDWLQGEGADDMDSDGMCCMVWCEDVLELIVLAQQLPAVTKS